MSTTTLSPNTYAIDVAHSAARFTVRHLMVSKVHGSFADITGSVKLEPAHPEEAEVQVIIGVASLTTGQEQRDGHLKSPDFFDVEQFPTIEFRSTKIAEVDENEFDVTGDLTIHGTTRAVTLRAELSNEIASPFGGYKIGVSATGKINREDFGMTWNQLIEAGGVAVGKEITLQIDVELDRPAE